MSGISYGDGSTKRTIQSVFYQDGATKRTIKAAWIGDGGTKRQVYTSYVNINAVTATPSSSNGTVVASPPAPPSSTVNAPNSGSIAITWAGGNPGATVSWSKVSGDTMSITTVDATHYRFFATVPLGGLLSATYRATVSDGVSSSSVNVPITLSYTSSG